MTHSLMQWSKTMKYILEHGMGSRRKHGGKVRRWDNHRWIKIEARSQRSNVRVNVEKTWKKEIENDY